jgi:two-component system nitrogen regulation sensor histidine kinase NtrY
MASSLRLLRGPAATAFALLAALTLFAWLLPRPGLAASKVLLALAIMALVWQLWSRTRRTNLTIARFVAALAHGDFAQSFRQSGQGAGFDELGAALDDALKRLRAERLASASEHRFAAALADGAPTPLLAIDPDGAVHLANSAARSLFREADGRAIAAFARYGEGFAAALEAAAPGARTPCRVLWNGLAQRAVLAVATVDRQHRPWRVVAVHIIQSELDAAEMATQTDLVRVLTHEIMNSLTPVTSLAESAARLAADAEGGDRQAAAEVRIATDALARRAAGLARFVDSYREFSRAPSLRIRRFEVRAWLDALLQVHAAMPEAAGVIVTTAIEPERLQIEGDSDLLGQIMLNLLKNGSEAARDARGEDARLTVRIVRTDAGRVRITVADNGAGVPAGLREDVFLPFFTTKPHGTGVGLSFARQVVLLHRGTIGLAPDEGDGARFEIVL